MSMKLILNFGLFVALAPAQLVHAKTMNFDEAVKYMALKQEVVILDPKTRNVIGVAPRSSLLTLDEKLECEFYAWEMTADDKHYGAKVRWKVSPNQSPMVKITHYDRASFKGPHGELTGEHVAKEQEISLKDFNAVSWPLLETETEVRVLRLTPLLQSEKIPVELDYYPIAGEQITVFDSLGNVWIDSFGIQGRFIKIEVPAKGAVLFLSTEAFDGSREMGSMKGSRLNLKPSKDLEVSLINNKDFVAGSQSIKIYGVFKRRPVDKGTSPILGVYKDVQQLGKALAKEY